MNNKKIKYKRISTLLFIGLLSTNIYANEIPQEQPLDAPHAFTSSQGDMTINGEVQATVVSFKIPQTVSFVLNPNGTTPDERFISPIFSIENNSNAPLIVSIKEMKSLENSPHKFTDVAPDKYTQEEWDAMNKKQSMSEIGLSVIPQDSSEWRNGEVRTFQAIEKDKTIGALNPHSSARLKLISKHGNAFESLQSDYQMTLIFDLLTTDNFNFQDDNIKNVD